MKISIILLPYINSNKKDIESDERIYNNILDIKERPWLKDVDEKFIFINENKKYVFDDVSIYYYLKYKNINVDYIFGDDDKIDEKIKIYDKVFLLYFDKLQAFHMLSKEHYKKIVHIFSYSNVYPKYEFQEFVNHKNVYYDFLKKHNIKVLPYLYISNKEKNNYKELKETIKIFIEKHKSYFSQSEKLYIKPIYGQNSYDSIDFTLNDYNTFIDYMEKYKNKYTSFIIQPFIYNFYYKYEYRTFFVENKYVYTIRSKLNENSKNNVNLFIEEYVPYVNCMKIVDFSKHVFNIIKKKYNEKNIIFAIDVSYDDNNELFVSEIEFSPYLFNYKSEVNKIKIDEKIGNAMINYINNNNYNYNYNNYIYIILCIIILIFYFYHFTS